jgi:PBP1b-binding outer membrane lipoprotein LpoB
MLYHVKPMRIIFFSVLLLVGCSGQSHEVQLAQQAEAQDALVQNSGSAVEKCASRKRVRDAWLAALDKPKYQYWSALADVACS